MKKILSIPLFILFMYTNYYWLLNHNSMDIYIQIALVLLSISLYFIGSIILIFYAKTNHIRIITARVLLFIIICYYLFFLFSVLLFSDFFFTRQNQYYVNKVPFKTIKSFLFTMKNNNDLNAFANLIGNAILFAPLGLFLPLIHRFFQNTIIFLFTTTLIVSTMEFAQYHFNVGSADIDDIILNVLGAFIVFVFVKFMLYVSKDKLHLYFKDDKKQPLNL